VCLAKKGDMGEGSSILERVWGNSTDWFMELSDG
jgi:hypothetical protein